MSAACQYETDVTDAQWDILHPLLPKPTWTPGSRERPPRPLRQVINGILYVNKTGLPVAYAAQRFGAMGDSLRLLSALAPGGGVGAGDDGAAPSRTPVPGAPRRAVGRGHR